MGRKGKGYGKLPPPIGRPINRSAPISQGLLLACPINEAGGLNVRDYAQGVVGTPTAILGRTARGSATASASRVSFVIGNPKNIASTNTSPFSVSQWLYYTGSASLNYLWGWGSSSFGTYSYISSGLISFDYLGANNFYVRTTSTVALVANTWNHVVCTRDSLNLTYPNSTNKIYINGVDVGVTFNGGNGTPSTVNLSALQFSIGARGTTSGWPGNINNFNMWNRKLSQTEIRKLYSDPYCMYK